MGQFEDKIELLRKYHYKIQALSGTGFSIKGDMPSKSIDNALKKFAHGLDRTTIIGFYDTTILENGKNGYIFTDTKVVYLESLDKPKKLWYDDIQSVSVHNMHKKDCDRELHFNLKDGSTVVWSSCFLNKTPLCSFFNELLSMMNQQNNIRKNTSYNAEKPNYAAAAAGFGSANYRQVNKSFDEEKFHGSRGYGYAAERANTLYDKLTGHNSAILGDDNAKNGADRIVDGTFIQSKYCQTGNACINECFEDGKFRYILNGKPMQIEVPSDKYDEAVAAMQRRISAGQVPGVSNPEEAENIVRKGHFTYKQALNLAKAGTIESLTYDAVNGTIIASSAFGVTAVITFATNLWNGEDFDKALKAATYSGLKVGGTAFLSSIIASQLSKMGLNSMLVGSSEAIVSLMGPKASAMIVNAFRDGGSKIFGAAAKKSAAKLLRGNIISGGVTLVIMSSFDIANAFQGKISGKQLFKNIVNTGAVIGGGGIGWTVGATVGSVLLPGAGTYIGGFVGSMVGGSVAGKASDTIVGVFVESDAEEMVRIIQAVFTELAEDYLLNSHEGEKAIDALADRLDGKKLMEMYASSDKHLFARNMLTPIIENTISRRPTVPEISDLQATNALRSVLEEMAETVESNDPPKSGIIPSISL